MSNSLSHQTNFAQALFARQTGAATRPAFLEIRGAPANRFTFGGLDYLSDKCAAALRARGIGEGARVAIRLPASAAFAVAQFALLKLGATAVPLPFSASGAMIERIIGEFHFEAFIIDGERRTVFRRMGDSIKPRFIEIGAASSGEFSENEYDFWREIAAAPSDFEAVPASGAAFCFLEMNGGLNVTPVYVSHEDCFEAMPAGEPLEIGLAGTPVETPADWANRETLLNSVCAAWWMGRAVAANRANAI